jgi:hypothetical protein
MIENRALGTIAGPLLWSLAKARVAQWERIAKSPRRVRRVQEAMLRAACRAAADSAFGRGHDLARVRTHADLVARVPLRTYDDYAPYIARLVLGERDVLVPGIVPYLGRSSGSTRTTNEKLIPITRRQIAWQRRQAFDALARYLTMTNDRTFPSGFTLGLLPAPLVEVHGEVGITNNPALMQLQMPRVARHVSLPRSPIREIVDQDERMRAIVATYLDHDVRALAGTTCWFPVVLERVIEAARARGRDVSTVRDVWPNLRGLFGGGVRTTAYRALLEARAGAPLALVDTYNATEGGLFAVSDRPDDEAMMVIPDRGVFYEFVPLVDHGRPDARRVPLWDVEPGVDYSVALSTSSGLFGYLVGDVVRFESVFPHRLVFAGRVGAELSIAHEATSVMQIEKAVRAAAIEHDVSIVEYTVSAEHLGAGAVGRYVIFAELERPLLDRAAFAASIDDALARENWLYAIHRKRDVALVAPVVVPLVRGAAHRFARLVGRDGPQQKYPRLVQPSSREERILRALVADGRLRAVSGYDDRVVGQ